MDMRRTCRIEDWFFGQGDDTAAKVQWYWAVDGAAFYEDATPFRSLDWWDGRSPIPDRPGPIKEPRFQGTYTNGKPVLGPGGLPAYPGTRPVCGDANWWRDGVPSPPPPTPNRNPLGVPDCCSGVTSASFSMIGGSSFSNPKGTNPFSQRFDYQTGTSQDPQPFFPGTTQAGIFAAYWVTMKFNSNIVSLSVDNPPGFNLLGPYWSGNVAAFLLYGTPPTTAGFYFTLSRPPTLWIAAGGGWTGAQPGNALDVSSHQVGASQLADSGLTLPTTQPFELALALFAGSQPFDINSHADWYIDFGTPLRGLGQINSMIAGRLTSGSQALQDTRITTPGTPNWIALVVGFSAQGANSLGHALIAGGSGFSAKGASLASSAFAIAGGSTLQGAAIGLEASPFAVAGDSSLAAAGASSAASSAAVAGDSSLAAAGASSAASSAAVAGDSSLAAAGASSAASSAAVAGSAAAGFRAVVTPVPFNAAALAIGNDPSWGINFPVPTTAGNTLVVGLASQRNGLGTADLPIAWPGGFTPGPSIIATLATVGVQLFYAENAASVTGVSGFDFAANCDGVIFCCELPNVPASGVSNGTDTVAGAGSGGSGRWGGGSIASGAIHRTLIAVYACGNPAKSFAVTSPAAAIIGSTTGGGAGLVRAGFGQLQQFSAALAAITGSGMTSTQYGMATQAYKAAT